MKTPNSSMKDMPLKPSQHVNKAIQSINKPPMRRLNVEVSEDQHAALKSRAASERKTIKQVIERLIAEYLK